MDNTLPALKEEFEKLFVHKGEEGDDPVDEWAWTIRGSFPFELWAWFEEKLSQSYKAGEEAERKRLFKEFIDIPRYVFNHKKYIKKEDVFPIFEALSPKENE